MLHPATNLMIQLHSYNFIHTTFVLTTSFLQHKIRIWVHCKSNHTHHINIISYHTHHIKSSTSYQIIHIISTSYQIIHIISNHTHHIIIKSYTFPAECNSYHTNIYIKNHMMQISSRVEIIWYKSKKYVIWYKFLMTSCLLRAPSQASCISDDACESGL